MPNPEGKIKFPLWIYPTTHRLVKNNYRKDNCRTMSQFIEKAIQYYVGKINAEDDTSYLPNAFLSNLKNVVMESEKRQKRELEFLRARKTEEYLTAMSQLGCTPDEIVNLINEHMGGKKYTQLVTQD